MANEAVMVQQLQDRQQEVTVAISGTFLKGAILGLFDPQIGSVTTSGNYWPAGIAVSEKVVDTDDKMAIWTEGIFDVKTSGTVAVVHGDLLGLSTTPNMVAIVPGIIAFSGGRVLGRAMQDGAIDEVIQMKLDIQ